MRTTTPTPRLRHAQPGDEIMLIGDTPGRTLIVGDTLDDGYINLTTRAGALIVIASPGHPTVPKSQ